MKTTNKKECPNLECKSVNVFDVGDRVSDVSNFGPGGEYLEPIYPIYECRECKERFVYEKPRFNWHASASNGGTLELRLNFSNTQTKEEKEKALAIGLVGSYKFMVDKGYLSFNERFKHGESNKYWKDFISKEKISYKEVDNMIFVHLWIKGYLGNKEKVDKYIQNLNKVVKLLQDSGQRNGKIKCPQCGEVQFEFSVNINYINGICRAKCGFYIHTTI